MNELLHLLISQLKATWRYRWHGMAAAWVVGLGGWTVVYLMPDYHVAYARVFVDTQSILRPLLSGLAVQPNVDQMVEMMGRTLVSRVNAEKVIDMAGMDAGLDASAGREELITRLIREVKIKSAGRENLYTITYADQDRQQAKRVVESLLSIFMQGSVGNKRRDSDSAQQFIEEQLRIYSEQLVAAENAVTEFKRRHLGQTPTGGQDYYSRLNEAKNVLRQAMLDLRVALNSRDAIKQRLAEDEAFRAQLAAKGAAPRTDSALDARLRGLEQRLDSLRLTYTDEHPDVVATARIIEQLKAQKATEERAAKPGASARLVGQVQQQLTVALATAEANVAATKARADEYALRYNELQAAANAQPQVEAEFKQLTRDYEVIKVRYDRLLERRESARISGDVEASDVVMSFRVVDPPQVPAGLKRPDRPRLMLMILAAAFGSGLGLAFLLGQMRPTFSDERGLREVTGLRVLGTVAMAWNAKQKTRRRLGLFAFVLSNLGLLSAFAAVMVLTLIAARA
jgi:polysaccharide chain length determinant protein (PEP-CTERM system associated)